MIGEEVKIVCPQCHGARSPCIGKILVKNCKNCYSSSGCKECVIEPTFCNGNGWILATRWNE